MSRTRLVLGLIALTFVAAEAIRPTRVPQKRIASRALIVRSQASPGGAAGTLDRALLEDLPRIHPDAIGSVQLLKRSDGSIELTGTAADPEDGGTGAAVFVEADGARRLEGRTTRYGGLPQPHAFSILIDRSTLGPGPHTLRIALVSSDQRGFFLLPDAVSS